MHISRIRELLEPFFQDEDPASRLDETRLQQTSTYIDLLLRWNARVNLTAIRTPEEIITRHFGESFFAARHLIPCGADTPVRVSARAANLEAQPDQFDRELSAQKADKPKPAAKDGRPAPLDASPRHSDRLVDIGSGAGFPGLPMKIWAPRTHVTLIESNHKKVAFLREVIRALTLTNINVFPARTQEFPPASADLVTLRAVERFEAILPEAVRLAAPAGRLALLIGKAQLAQAQTRVPGMMWLPAILIPLSASRIVATAEIAQATNSNEPD